MIRIGLQFFAHKKGGGSTKNGRDSKAKRLAPSVPTVSSSRPATSWCVSAAPTSTPV